MKKGLLIIYSGPSGVGKSSILRELLKKDELNLVFSVSMTTRKPRPGEKDGKDYFFVDEESFVKAIKEDKFLEHAKYVENYYGTPSEYVDKKRNEGKNVILEIDVQGGLQVIEKVKDSISIFVTPPSVDDLKKRLNGRGTEKQETIDKRIDAAAKEIESGKVYKYHIVNDDLNECVEQISQIIKKEME